MQAYSQNRLVISEVQVGMHLVVATFGCSQIVVPLFRSGFVSLSQAPVPRSIR